MSDSELLIPVSNSQLTNYEAMSDKDEKKKKRKILDKILMGAVIGGAIGSVVGATIAPKKGKETRKNVVEAVKHTKKSGSRLFKIFKKFIFKKREGKDKKIPHEHV